MSKALMPLIAGVVLAGCATTPDPIRDAEVQPLSVAEVREAPARYRGTRVRWGGSIVGVENRPEKTIVEVLSRALKKSGAPEPDGAGQGRFRASFSGFLDPSDYSEGRWMTVVGEVTGSEEGLVGEYAYTFPVVDVETMRLWRSREEIDPPPPPYYYHPWYDPWWGPWGPWYRRHPYWW